MVEPSQNSKGFLPVSRKEAAERGWDEVDFVCVTGDAYVDHPSFGIAIISRLLEKMGFRVGILSQPDPNQEQAFLEFGKPKLGFFVTSGNIDSMVNHYTAARKKRSGDAYSPGGKSGRRPDRALTVYCNRIRQACPETVIIIGGLEASLRRFAHYDYWDDSVHPSILADTQADLLVYGMGEHQTREIAQGLADGLSVEDLHGLRGICYLADQAVSIPGLAACPSFEKVAADKAAYARAFQMQALEQDSVRGKPLVQKHGQRFLIQTAPSLPLSRQELDEVFSLPFQRMYHPSYEALGGVPAIEEVEFSIQHNRGCFGNCNFCALAFHQGREVTSRSRGSVVKEAKSFLANPRFKGYIHDVGGPTANFRHPSCGRQIRDGLCRDRKCLAPKPCPHLIADHREYDALLKELREIKGIKKVFIRSGIRFDYLMADPDRTFFRNLVKYHVSGQLKVAPEHCSNHVLDAMGKPHIETYEAFSKLFYAYSKEAGKEQYLVPYLISSHPGSTLRDAVELAVFLKKNRIRPEQVQDFYPTPGTPSTCMFYTGLEPFTLRPVFVARTPEEKQEQRILLQYFKPENQAAVIKALEKAGRQDLIGTSPNCLVRPLRREQKDSASMERSGSRAAQKNNRQPGNDVKENQRQAQNRKRKNEPFQEAKRQRPRKPR